MMELWGKLMVMLMRGKAGRNSKLLISKTWGLFSFSKLKLKFSDLGVEIKKSPQKVLLYR